MPTLVVLTPDGKKSTIEGKVGISVMENIRDAGFSELPALCGGCLSCATCHVRVNVAEFAEMLPRMSSDENELLESSSARTENSRLSCQIPFAENLNGIQVEIVGDA